MSHSSRLVALATLLIVVGLATTAFLAGCGDGRKLPQVLQEGLEKVRHPTASTNTANSPGEQSTVPAAAPGGGTIRIASFNIQVFGGSKLSKAGVMQVLTQIVRRFDIVAIQEVRSKTDDVLPRFVDMINADGSHYEFLIGPRLGRTNSKEQYAFVYDATRLEFDPRTVYTVDDPDDLLHREPLVARFRVRGVPPQEAFSFTLVNIHTDPDEARAECDALAKVYESVRQDGSGEDDVIVLGDLNVDEFHLGKLGALPQMVHAITGVATNTRGDKMYDNILFQGPSTREFTGTTGVLDVASQFGLSLQQALEVSDHQPVWAEFSVYEAPPASGLATRPRTAPR